MHKVVTELIEINNDEVETYLTALALLNITLDPCKLTEVLHAYHVRATDPLFLQVQHLAS